MKDSGIEWIGEIPEDWEVRKLGNISDLYTGNSIKDSEKDNYTQKKGAIPYVATKDVGFNNQIDYDNGMYIPKNEMKFKKAYPGDTLICIEGGSAGRKIAQTKEKISFGNKLCCINSNVIDKNYMYYYILSPNYQNGFNSRITGLIPGVTLSEMSQIEIIVPKNHEQRSIANFLDEKTEEIDNIISKTKNVIEEYKKYKQSLIAETVTKGLEKNVSMKNSGIEWVEELPSHWNIARGKNILKLLERTVLDSDEVVTCFRDGEVTLRKNRREDGFTIATKEIGYQGIEKNDLIVHGMDGFAGAIGISDSRGKGSPVLNVLATKQDNKKYLMYYLRDLAFRDVFIALSTGIRERSVDLRWTKLADLEFIIPPIEEQKEIAKFLDKKTSEIDHIIETKEKLVKELEAYKKSLIYETVTGKREVN